MRDKAIGEMAEILFPLAERVIATRADNPRSASPEEIREAAVRTSTRLKTPRMWLLPSNWRRLRLAPVQWWLLPDRYTL